jgi:hypothetical protein
MANLFDDDKNDNVRDDGRPRIVFSNLRRPSRPILAEGGYRAFSAVSTSSWFLVVFFIWIFQFEVTPSEALISQIAGSSVELSALAIALLAILLEVNRADRWFKLGLLVIATSLVGVVLGGFYLALTWQESFSKPQQITVVIVGILGVTAALQVEWKGLWRFLRLPEMNKALPGFAHWLPRLRISIQFLLPIGLIWLPGLNRVTAVLVLFLGSILSLLALMLVTTLSVLRTKQTQAGDEEEEDPFMRTLRQRYENDIRVLIRVGEIKVAITNALKSLQEEERDAAQKRSPGFDLSGNVPNLVAWYDLKIRLRGSGLKDDDRYLERALDSLKSDATVYGEGYRDGLWLVPTEEEILDCIPALLSLRLVYSTLCSDYAKKHGSCFEGLDATKLTRCDGWRRSASFLSR